MVYILPGERGVRLPVITRKDGEPWGTHIANRPLNDCLQVSTPHPEFQRSMHAGHEFFFDSYEEALLTEEEMVDEVEWNLSRRITMAEQQFWQATGLEPTSYLHRLGWVVGTIAKGLTYAR